MLLLNMFSFYGVNFTFICSLIYMVWKIRKIEDHTLISKECKVIVFIQLVFSMMQSLLNASNEAYGCIGEQFPIYKFETIAYKAQFWLTIS